jgi:hypothetical protein
MIFKRFETDDIIQGNPSEVTTGLWTGDTGSLAGFVTSSTQVASDSSKYYVNIFDTSAADQEVQFAVAYGHADGGAASTLAQDDTAKLETKVTYLQYKNLLLDPTDDYFTFGTFTSHHIYVVNIQRARTRGRLDAGNWELVLSGSRGKSHFIDDSLQTLGANVSFGKSGRVFNIVSGSLTGVSGSTIAATSSSNAGTFGLCYPDLGILVFNPSAISESVGFIVKGENSSSLTNMAPAWNLPFAPYTASLAGSAGVYYPQYSHWAFVRSMQLGNDFQARSSEIISSTHYFVRLRNKEYNYTNNPTFYNLSNGTINNEDFVNNPRVYVTTVGLYNDNNELLAVGKLSKPVEKSFEKEALIRVRLDF